MYVNSNGSDSNDNGIGILPSHITVDLGYGLKFKPVVAGTQSECLRCIEGPKTEEIGWRAVYLGYNQPQDITRWNLSRFRRLMPESHLVDRVAKPERMGRFGFSREIKISRGWQEPTIFWGQIGALVLKELHIFLSDPKTDKLMPRRRNVLYPMRNYGRVPGQQTDVYRLWVNGTLLPLTLPRNKGNAEFLKRLQQYQELTVPELIQCIEQRQLPTGIQQQPEYHTEY